MLIRSSEQTPFYRLQISCNVVDLIIVIDIDHELQRLGENWSTICTKTLLIFKIGQTNFNIIHVAKQIKATGSPLAGTVKVVINLSQSIKVE